MEKIYFHRNNMASNFICLLLTVLFSLIIMAACQYVYGEFFFIDDAKNEFLPIIKEIGRQIMNMELPLMTSKMMLGGNFVVEMVSAIFSPITIIVAIFSYFCNDAYCVALFFAFINIFIVFLTGIFLAKLFLKQMHTCLLISFLLTTNPLFIYIALPSWWNFAQSYAYFVLFVFCCFNFLINKSARNYVFLFLSKLCVISTVFTHTLIIALCTLVVVAVYDYAKNKKFNVFIPYVLICICSALVCFPIISEYLHTKDITLRFSGVFANNNFQIPPISQILFFFLPLYGDFMLWFGGQYIYMPANFGYSTAIYLFILFFGCYKNRTIFFYIFATLICISFFCSQFSAYFLSTTAQFRYLIFLVFFEIVLFATFFDGTHFQYSRKRIFGYALVTLTSIILSIFRNPHSDKFIVLNILFFVCMVFLPLAVRFIGKKNIFLFFSIILFALSLAHVKSYGDEKQLLSNKPFSDDIHFQHENGIFLSLGYNYELIGARSLYHNIKSVHGYSSIGSRILNKNIPFEHIFAKNEALDNLLKRDVLFGEYIIDLYNIGYLIADKNSIEKYRNELEGADFIFIDETEHTYFLKKAIVNTTYVSYISPTIQYEYFPSHAQRKEKIKILNNETGGDIILSKLWWPGYTAHINGTPLTVNEYEGVVRIILPPKAVGTLLCEYWPISWKYALPISIFGIFLFLMTILFRKQLILYNDYK